MNEIKEIIFGDVRLSPQDENDALNVFTAQKYSAIFVTADGELLLGADRLHQQARVEVMTDEDAVRLVRKRILERDWAARDRLRNDEASHCLIA